MKYLLLLISAAGLIIAYNLFGKTWETLFAAAFMLSVVYAFTGVFERKRKP